MAKKSTAIFMNHDTNKGIVTIMTKKNTMDFRFSGLFDLLHFIPAEQIQEAMEKYEDGSKWLHN